MRTTRTRPAAFRLSVLALGAGAIVSTALTACSPVAEEAASTPDVVAAIAPPAVNEEGVLSVCSALGLGAERENRQAEGGGTAGTCGAHENSFVHWSNQ